MAIGFGLKELYLKNNIFFINNKQKKKTLDFSFEQGIRVFYLT